MASLTFELESASVELGGREILRGIDLSIPAGSAIALVGPSGAGKTTLLRLLNGSLHPTRGTVRILGKDLAAATDAEQRRLRSRIGFVHQDHSLVPVLRAAQNVLAGRLGRVGFLRGLQQVLLARRSALEEVHAVLERVGVADKLFQRTDTLSGGEQQRVAIARALYQEPTALLADEPVASVDPARARDIVELLTRLASEERLTLVASLHDLGLAREFFPRVIGLRAGRLVADARTDTLRDDDFAALYELAATGTEGAESAPARPRASG